MERQSNFEILKNIWPGQSAWLMAEREKSAGMFERQGWPSAAGEAFKYTSFRKLEKLQPRLHFATVDDQAAQTALQTHLDDPNFYRIVFIDGQFRPGWSEYPNSAVEIFALNGGSGDPSLQRFYEGRQSWDENPFHFLSGAYFTCGFGVRLVDHAALDKPLHVITYLSESLGGDSAGLGSVQVQNWVELGVGSRLAIAETTFAAKQNRYFFNSATHLVCAEGSSLDYVRVSQHPAQAFATQGVRLACGPNVRVNFTEVSLAQGFVRNDLKCSLGSAGTQLISNGMYWVTGSGHIDNHVSVEHQAPQCETSQLYKGIITDAARAVFDGRILIAQGAEKTNARQLNKNLLLGDQAEVDTKPNLQIYADDVKATHGATIGRLSEEEIFYLQSRAITREQALALLCRGFLGEVVDRIEDKPLRDLVNTIVRPALQRLEVD